jgi:hypothetical protein
VESLIKEVELNGRPGSGRFKLASHDIAGDYSCFIIH